MIMKVTKQWLENKISELNNWLKKHEKGIHFEYAQKLHNRNFYVKKLIELEENNLESIKI